MTRKVPKRHQPLSLSLGLGSFQGNLAQKDIQSVVVWVFEDDDLILCEGELCEVFTDCKFVDQNLVKVLIVLFFGYLTKFVVSAADDDYSKFFIVCIVARLSHRVNYGVLHGIFIHRAAKGLRCQAFQFDLWQRRDFVQGLHRLLLLNPSRSLRIDRSFVLLLCFDDNSGCRKLSLVGSRQRRAVFIIPADEWIIEVLFWWNLPLLGLHARISFNCSIIDVRFWRHLPILGRQARFSSDDLRGL